MKLDERTARASVLAQALFIFWFIGTAVLGKRLFSYLSIGPVFITEFVLFVLILENIFRLRLADLVFFTGLGAYIVAGYFTHGNIFFVGKDMAPMYYLLFLRFTPRNLSPFVVRILFVFMVLGFFLAAFELLPAYIDQEKYRTSIILYALLALIFWRMGYVAAMVLGLPLVIVGSYLINFKTAILMGILFPFLTGSKRAVKFVRFTPLFLCSLAFVFLTISSLPMMLMGKALGLINYVLSEVGISTIYSDDTAVWRVDIWSAALKRLFQDFNIWTGILPGLNFISTEFLRVPIPLVGGDQVGVLRSAHNIVVQLVMKTGILGLGFFFLFYFRWRPRFEFYGFEIFQLIILVGSMTADIIEVPSRGPFFFSIMILFSILERHERAKRLAREARMEILKNTSIYGGLPAGAYQVNVPKV